LDANYYKGQGLRQGIEREYVVVARGDIRNDSRSPDSEDFIRGGTAYTLNSRDHKGVMLVVLSEAVEASEDPDTEHKTE